VCILSRSDMLYAFSLNSFLSYLSHPHSAHYPLSSTLPYYHLLSLQTPPPPFLYFLSFSISFFGDRRASATFRLSTSRADSATPRYRDATRRAGTGLRSIDHKLDHDRDGGVPLLFFDPFHLSARSRAYSFFPRAWLIFQQPSPSFPSSPFFLIPLDSAPRYRTAAYPLFSHSLSF
jgi:hypothetical protein